MVEEGRITVNLPPSAFELLGLAPRDRIFYRVVWPDGSTLTGYEDFQFPADVANTRSLAEFRKLIKK